MDSSEREKSENHQPSGAETAQTLDTTPTKLSDSADYSYEDDFEELDSSVNQEKSQDASLSQSASATTTSSDSDNREADPESDAATTDTSAEKEKDSSIEGSAAASHKPQSPSAFDDPQSDDSEPEPEGDVLFTDDQQRAMMELMAQKHDSGDYADDPPEYNVKERLKELNAELAMEPDPDDRHHRVGFKEDLVDLVAPPPPEVSDDEDTPRKAPADDGDTAGQGDKAGAGSGEEKKKQFVVERDGKFDVVADHELTASERAMFNIPGDEDRSETEAGDAKLQSGSGDGPANPGSQGNKENVQPVPPPKPRPKTAGGFTRRPVRPSQSPRPQTASPSRSYNNPSTLQDFNYNSPYAMSSKDKERAQERARMKEQQKKEEERRRKQEEEYARQESEDAFQAWLKGKREEDRRRREEEEKNKKKNAKDDHSKENDEAFKGWLKTKQVQIRREKLLKKREEQEIKDGYYVRSREECDQAYREWLKKKYTEIRRQRAADKQRARSFRSYSRKSRKQQMMARAVRQSQAFRYVDYYGYRF